MSIGLVAFLEYKNSLYREFQCMKHHLHLPRCSPRRGRRASSPRAGSRAFRSIICGARCFYLISLLIELSRFPLPPTYRHSLPSVRRSSAGMVNAPNSRGTHSAMRLCIWVSGIDICVPCGWKILQVWGVPPWAPSPASTRSPAADYSFAKASTLASFLSSTAHYPRPACTPPIRSTPPPLRRSRLHRLARYVQAPCFFRFILHSQCIKSSSDPSPPEHPTSNSASKSPGTSASSESAESSEAEIVDLRRYSAAFPCSLAHAGAPGARASPCASGSRAACSTPGWTRCCRLHGFDDLPLRVRDAPGGDVHPPFEPRRSTNLISSVAFTGTSHAEGEAVHLRVMRSVDGPALSAVDTQGAKANAEGKKGGVDAQEMAARRQAHITMNVGAYAGLLQRACLAWVYDYVADDEGRFVPGNAGADGEAESWEGTKLVINSQVCCFFLPDLPSSDLSTQLT
ncbi:hypothetical protein DFH09DRAFT_1482434 [Mycena vulgaris]|nr:hypothetical protein DFH09DRAFT_1482434 [Mycena vulgaris]